MCGAVRYEMGRLDMPLGHCHCVTCRKAHAAAYASTAEVVDPAAGGQEAPRRVGWCGFSARLSGPPVRPGIDGGHDPALPPRRSPACR